MKKLLLAAVANTALGCTFAPISAMAQSSVTLYELGGHSDVSSVR
ncbi:hypothetical protein [Paraburkholderia solitsugae]|nr:hypothetical protein [Paraburkholderia solitsugae]